MHASDSDERRVRLRALTSQCCRSRAVPLCVALIVRLPFSASRCRYSCDGGEGHRAPQGARPPPCDSIRRLVQYIRSSHFAMLTINHKLGCAGTRQLGFTPMPRAIVEPDEKAHSSTGQCLQVLSCECTSVAQLAGALARHQHMGPATNAARPGPRGIHVSYWRGAAHETSSQ